MLATGSAPAAPNAAASAAPIVVVPVPVPVPSSHAAPDPAAHAAKAPAAHPAPAAPTTAPAPALPTEPVVLMSIGSLPPTAAPGKAAAKLPAPKTPVEAAIQQVVMLERGGHPIAIGIPLNGDGRILTALSPLTHGNQIMARYPEGQLVPVRMSYSDRAWDFALLTPLGETRRSGLKASHAAPPTAGTKVHALSYVRDKQLGVRDVTLKAKNVFRGADSAELADAYELASAPKPSDLGTPLVNDQGEVVAIVARACAMSDKRGCTLAPYAAPLTAVRDFLRAAPARKNHWLGMQVVAFDAGFARGVRVDTVSADGPAANSGLRAGPAGVGDVVLAVDGKPVASAETFSDAIENREPGSPARLTVLTDGRYREVVLTTSTPPDTPTLAPTRNDRAFKSNPSAGGPETQPAPIPNP